jgi:uncharacterized protein (TIGR03000 family)
MRAAPSYSHAAPASSSYYRSPNTANWHNNNNWNNNAHHGEHDFDHDHRRFFFGFGYYPWWGWGWDYPGYGYYDYYPWYWGYGRWYTPSYLYGYGSDFYGSSAAYNSTLPYDGYADYAAPALQSVDAVHINVRVPADAQVWFEGAPTSQQGTVREFESPPIPAGQDFIYEITAHWRDNGKDVDSARKVRVRAGQAVNVDFTRPLQQAPQPLPPEPRT